MGDRDGDGDGSAEDAENLLGTYLRSSSLNNTTQINSRNTSQGLSHEESSWSSMSGWRIAPARRLFSTASRVTESSPLFFIQHANSRASHSFTSTRQQYLHTSQRREESTRSRWGHLARTRRKFTTSSVQRHGHLDPPKPGEELVYTRYELSTVLMRLCA